MVWCGVVRLGVLWCGVVWCGVVWSGVMWFGVAWRGVLCCGVVWCTERLQNDGKKVSHVHLRWINPLPKDLGEILIRFKNILIPELNMGQLSKLIRADYLVDAVGLNLVKDRPFKASDIVDKVKEIIG